MNKINRKVEYALVALKHMSHKRPGELSTVKEICQLYTCPFDATSRVMQSLAQKQILKSEQGAYGGYQIMRDLRKVSLYDLIEVTVGPIEIAKCMSSEKGSERQDRNPQDAVSHEHKGMVEAKKSSDEPVGGCDMSAQCNITLPVRLLNDKLIQFYRSINIWDLLTAEGKDALPLRDTLSFNQGSARETSIRERAISENSNKEVLLAREASPWK